MNHRFLFAALVLLPTASSFAQDPQSYRCSYGDLQRRVEILSEPGVSVPCEVHYYKDTEAPGERQVLWSASNEVGYCEQKTREFIVKLQDWGWDCGERFDPESKVPEPQAMPEPADDSTFESEPEQVDDTDALIPADDATLD